MDLVNNDYYFEKNNNMVPNINSRRDFWKKQHYIETNGLKLETL